MRDNKAVQIIFGILAAYVLFPIFTHRVPNRQEVENWFATVRVGDSDSNATDIMESHAMSETRYPKFGHGNARIIGEVTDGDHVISVEFKVDENERITSINISEGNRGL